MSGGGGGSDLGQLVTDPIFATGKAIGDVGAVLNDGVSYVDGRKQKKAEKMKQRAKEDAQKQREYDLKQIETQKNNKFAIEEATKKRNAKSNTQKRNRKNSETIVTDSLGEAGGDSKNLLGL